MHKSLLLIAIDYVICLGFCPAHPEMMRSENVGYIYNLTHVKRDDAERYCANTYNGRLPKLTNHKQGLRMLDLGNEHLDYPKTFQNS